MIRLLTTLMLAAALSGCASSEPGIQDWDATRDDGTEIPDAHGQDLIPRREVNPI